MSQSEWIWGEDRAAQHFEEHYPADSSYYDTGVDLTPIKRMFAGVVSFMLALMAGMKLGDSTMVAEATVNGQEAIVMNGPDGPFWVATATGFIALLFLMYATAGGFEE